VKSSIREVLFLDQSETKFKASKHRPFYNWLIVPLPFFYLISMVQLLLFPTDTLSTVQTGSVRASATPRHRRSCDQVLA